VYEIVEELGVPDVFAIPFGGGGNTSAYAQALRELSVEAHLVAAQAADRAHTLASAIRIQRPAHAGDVAASGATVATVDDAQIVAAWRVLAVDEGVFCEPSSAAGLAAIAASPPRGSRVVLTLTGHGLKDTASVDAHTAPALQVDPDPDAIERAAS
jgi:threonine synthase